MKLKVLFALVCILRAYGGVWAINPLGILLEGYMGQIETNPGVSCPLWLLGAKPGVTPETHGASFQPELVDTLQKRD